MAANTMEGAGATRARGLRALPRMLARAPRFLLKLARMTRLVLQAWATARFSQPLDIHDSDDCAREMRALGLAWPPVATNDDESLLQGVIHAAQGWPAEQRPISSGPDGPFGRWLLGSDGTPVPPSSRARVRDLWLARPSLAARRLWHHLDHLRSMLPEGILPPWRRSLFRWMARTARLVHGTPVSSTLWFMAELGEDPSAGADEMWLDSPAWQRAHPRGLDSGRTGFLAWASGRSGRVIPAETAPVVGPVETAAPGGVNLYGHFCYPSGLSEAAWQMRRALEAAGVPVAPRDMPATVHHDKLDREGMRGPEIHPVSIHLLPPEHTLADIHARSMSHARHHAARVAVWYWELERAPGLWAKRAKAYQEIWAPTRFIRDSFASSFEVPVRTMTPGLAMAPFEPRSRSYYGLPETPFLVLFSFDMCSVFERKNPLGLIRAFRKAFRQGEDAVLAIKVTRGDHDPGAMALLRHEEAAGKVIIIDQVMTRADTNALTACCDAYASLHRAEGFGLTMAEAMLLGKPVVATDYSGNRDFMTKRTSYLAGYRKVPIARDLPQYPAGIPWAEPDEDEAADHLRRMFERPAEARAVALRGQALARRVLDPVAASHRLRQRLSELAGFPLQSRAA